jgi:transcription initiation factor TFIID subunit 11
MTEEEQARFEFFVRSHLPRDKVRAIMEEALGVKEAGSKEVTNEMVIVASGLTKLFIGEICDAASDVVRERGDKNGIQVDHIQ